MTAASDTFAEPDRTWPPGEGGMAGRIRAHDWAAGALGPCEAWSPRLKLMVEQMLAFPLVASLVCGAERLLIYNDAAARLYGDSHPAALGRPLPEVFPEGWTTVAPFYARVFDGQSVTVSAQPLDTRGEGDPAADIFDAVLSPVREADGRVAYAYMTGAEVGARLRAQARLAESEASYRYLFNAIDEGFCTIEMLFDAEDRPVDYRVLAVNAVFEKQTGLANAVGRTAREMVPDLESHWFETYGRIALTGESERFEDRADALGRWYDVYAFRVGPPERRRVGVLFNDVLPRKRAEAALRASEERQAFLLKLADALRPSSDPVAVQDMAARILGEHLDADRAYYVALDEARQVATVEREYRRGDVPSLIGRHAYAAFGATLDLLRRGEAVVFDDVETASNVAPDDLPGYRALGLRAFLNWPLIKDGVLVCAMCVVSQEPRRWTAADRTLVAETAERTWAAVERAHAEAALRESEERQAFLLTLSDTLRPLADPRTIVAQATRLLGDYAQVDRTFIAEIEPDGVNLDVHDEYLRSGAPSVIGHHNFDLFGTFVSRELVHGNLLAVDDVAALADLTAAERAHYAAVGIGAYCLVPLVRDGRLAACLTMNHRTARPWTEADRNIAQQTADRTWAAVERARIEAVLRESEALLAAQNEAFQAAVNGAPLDASLGALVRATVARFGEVRCAFYVVAPNGTELRPVAGTTELYAPRADGFRIGADSLACGLAVSLGEPVLTPDVRLEPRWEPWLWLAEEHDYRGVWSFPMTTSAGGHLGTFALYFRQPREADASDRGFAANLAYVAGIVLSRNREAEERARAEAALRESEERFAQFASSSSDALWIRDAATMTMEYTSPAIEPIYGIAPDAILGDPARWLALIVPDDREAASAHLEQARAGEAVVHEFRIVRRSDGEERWVRNTDFPLRDAQGRVQRVGGIAEDVTEAKRAASRLEVLVNELQHRSRNLLGVVTSVAGRTLRQGSTVAAFEERLQALSRAQGLLSQHGSDTVEVEALVRAELAAHADAGAPHVHVAGPRVHLTARQVQNFALALHELTTNAVKYGALTVPGGRLAVTWAIVPGRRGRRRLALDWIERGVAIAPGTVTRRGYGTELIQEALAYALQARVDYALGADGVRCRIELPIA